MNEVYAHLNAHYGIHSLEAFAERVHVSKSTISNALNRTPASEKLVSKICEAFPQVFNDAYILRGVGSLLTPYEESRIAYLEPDTVGELLEQIRQKDGVIARLNTLVAEKDATIDRLNRQLAMAIERTPAAYSLPEGSAIAAEPGQIESGKTKKPQKSKK